jgi:hypothetical protein
MKNPSNLTREELVEITTGIVRILYGREHADGSWTYSADKEWCGGDVCGAAALLLDRFGLVPRVEGNGEPMDGQ